MNLKIFSVALALTSSLPTLAFAMEDNQDVSGITSVSTFRIDQAMSTIGWLMDKAEEDYNKLWEFSIQKAAENTIQDLAKQYAIAMLQDEEMKKAIAMELWCFKDENFQQVGVRAVQATSHVGIVEAFSQKKDQYGKEETAKGEKYSYLLWKIVQAFREIELSLLYYTTQSYEKTGNFLKLKQAETLDAYFQQQSSEKELYGSELLKKLTTHLVTLESKKGESFQEIPTIESVASSIQKLLQAFDKSEYNSEEEENYLKNIWSLKVAFNRVTDYLEEHFRYDAFTNFLGSERFEKPLNKYFSEKYPSEVAGAIVVEPSSILSEEDMLQSPVTASAIATSSHESEETFSPVSVKSTLVVTSSNVSAVPSAPPPPHVAASSNSTKSSPSLSDQLASVALKPTSERELAPISPASSSSVIDSLKSGDHKTRLKRVTDRVLAPASSRDENPVAAGLRRAFGVFEKATSAFAAEMEKRQKASVGRTDDGWDD